MLLNFLSFKHATGCTGTSLRLYVQALRHKHVLGGMNLTPFSSPRLRLLVQGAMRTAPAERDGRAAATMDDLLQLAAYLRAARLPDHDRAMLWSAVTLAFHGLLRVSEYTQMSDRCLTRQQVSVRSDSISIHLAVAKTAQFGSGQDVNIQRTGTPTCPHAALADYLAVRGQQPGPLYFFQNGRCLKASDVNALLRTVFPGQHISSHSLRIGAATLAGQHNVPEYRLKNAGRWRSAAYLRYVRTATADRALPAGLFRQG